MPTDELKQALRTANIRGAEKDLIEVIARMLDAPIPLVARVVYAATRVQEQNNRIDWDRYFSTALRQAIANQAGAGMARVTVRETIHRNGYVMVWVDAMVPESAPDKICEGCPKSLECVSESLHKPSDCRVGKGAWAKSLEAKPIKINGDEVTVDCAHPKGRFTLNIKDLDL